MADIARVLAVHVNPLHGFTKSPQTSINLIKNHGVEGDAHAGPLDKHRFHIRKYGQHRNLRQVHLIQSELFDALAATGHSVKPGEIGENITTRNIDLLSLPTGTRLKLGRSAVVELTGLRNPCHQIEEFQAGLLEHLVERRPEGLIRRAGVMSIVVEGGRVEPDDPIVVELPVLPHRPLIYRVPELEVEITGIKIAADDIRSIELRSVDRTALPAFTAGAHIELRLTPEISRCYSLCNDPAETDRYVVTVLRNHGGRGGSKYVHDQLQVGQRMTVRPPHNNFPLNESASHAVMIAGGIGITPFASMAQRLNTLGYSWRLYYSARHRRSAAFLAEFEEMALHTPGQVDVSLRSEGHPRFDFGEIFASAPTGAHYYCCGPQTMIEAFRDAAARSNVAAHQVHLEMFSGTNEPFRDGGFTINLQRSGLELAVLPGHTILETLLASGVHVPSSCREGICGTCILPVLGGAIDHRDHVLTPEERVQNDRIVTCCSGSNGTNLVLDV